MISLWRGWIGILLLGLTQNLSDGVYTGQQATRGQTIYKARCTSCHGDNLACRTGPPLAGADFLSNWSAQPLSELAAKIRNTMPKDMSDRLNRQDTADLVAYILQGANFPSGRTELAGADADLARVRFPAVAAANKTAATAQPAMPVTGNVGQIMRGIFFPSSNIIFTVQSIDPGTKKFSTNGIDTAAGFDWLAWGQGIYPAWDVVDYAAISVADSATLLLAPGRRCENGKLAPVTDPDWIKFTNELAEAGKASYKASQTRNQQLVSDSTNQLNDSCSNCHRVYRGRTHCVK